MELGRQTAERAQRRLRRLASDRLALAAPDALQLAMPPIPVPTESGELFGLPADSGRGPVQCLNLADQNSLRAICRVAKHLVDFEILMCTRSGRVMGNAAARSRRLLGFLTRHAKLLQRVDVRQAPTLAVVCLRTCFLLEIFLVCIISLYFLIILF